MIIHAPELARDGDEVRLSVRVEFRAPPPGVPDRLWMSFPEDQQELLTDRADGFAAALMLRAMASDEEIEVRGALSPRLVYGMREYQRIVNLWFPQTYKLVDIKADTASPADADGCAGRGVASAFSGGVDSFFTLWSHLPDNESDPGSRIGYGLFVHGFDIPLEDEATYQACRQAYGETWEGLGLRLLTARTNVRHFLGDCDWTLVHGGPLIGVALALGRSLRRFYTPGGMCYRLLGAPTGTDPRLDHLLSTETLQVVHHGAGATRVQKVSAIADWRATYSRLRVCWVHPDGLVNCSRCSKCIRTMIAMELAGGLSRYETFGLPLDRRRIRASNLGAAHERAFARELLDAATAGGREDLASDLRYALRRSLAAGWRTRLDPRRVTLRRAIRKAKALLRTIGT